MNLSKAKELLLSAETTNDLYIMELDLVEYSNSLHKQMMTAQSAMEQSDIKGKLSMANALLGICKERQEELRDVNGRSNYNFRMAAKAMLQRSTYDAISFQAAKPRKEFKMQDFKNKLIS